MTLKAQGFVILNKITDENLYMVLKREEPGQTTESTEQRLSIQETELKKLFPLSIETLLSKVGVTIDNVNSAHIQGSRLYETDKLKSDWDVLIVAGSKTPYRFYEFSVNGVDFDVHVFSVVEFHKKIEALDLATLEFIFHPNSAKLIENSVYSVNLNHDTLKVVAEAESLRQWTVAEAILRNPDLDPYKGLKRIWHSIRYLMFTKQLLNSGTITDFTEASSLSDPILQEDPRNVDAIIAKYAPTREQLLAEIKKII
jgi:hypothetical protein